MSFDVIKRDHSWTAETPFYRKDDFSASFTAGRHSDHRWMTGIRMQYAF